MDVRDLDTSTEILGAKLSCPVILAPAGFQKAFHPEGEIAVARAAKRKDHLQILSTGSSASLEEDASLCVEHGVDGIIVSNHGGRVVDSGLSTIEALPEIVEAVAGRYLWGLAAFGQAGVESVLAILRREFETTMRQMGTRTLEAITPAHVQLTR